MSISASRRNLSSSFLSHVTRFYVRAVLARSVLMVWRSASVGGVRVKQPIGRALSMGLSESEDGSAATGQNGYALLYFLPLMYVPPHKKKMFSLRVPYVLHCMYTDVNCVVFGPFELGPTITITYPLCLNYPPRAHLMV